MRTGMRAERREVLRAHIGDHGELASGVRVQAGLQVREQNETMREGHVSRLVLPVHVHQQLCERVPTRLALQHKIPTTLLLSSKDLLDELVLWSLALGLVSSSSAIEASG